MVDLKEYGWSEPVDESPFDLPDGWEGGRVVNTGGNIFCRIWRYPEYNIEVIYNAADPGIGVQVNNGIDGVEILDTLDTPTTDDADKQEVARKYIQEDFDLTEFEDTLDL